MFVFLQGIHQKINYLQSLGVDCIWLSPFYEFGGVDNGFDWIDHTKVDVTFGTDADLTTLLEELARRGKFKINKLRSLNTLISNILDMKVILDFIPNHTSLLKDWFQKSADGSDEKYRDYYVWTDSPNEWVIYI